MKELTVEEILDIVCDPGNTDEPEESDFIDEDENIEEFFVNNLIAKELN